MYDCPARDEGENTSDSLDADLIDIDGIADALNSPDITAGIPALM
jgi:hypothetical protein